VIGPGMAAPSWAGVGRWFTAAYFSVTTFVTLGYGDVRSAPCLGRLAAGTEALAGFVLLSLFLVCVVRKFSR
jgi:voltage-gated potassium channel Kch